MNDWELLDYLCGHPITSRWDGLGDETWTLTCFAAIGRGPDFRSALMDLIANDRAKGRGIPNARDKALAST